MPSIRITLIASLALVVGVARAQAPQDVPPPPIVEAPSEEKPSAPVAFGSGDTGSDLPSVKPAVSELPDALLPTTGTSGSSALTRSLAGSIQLDYLAVPTSPRARQRALDGATLELSLKLAVDLGKNATANVKLCYACHGPEVGMAFFDLRGRDQINARVGRFTPAFGSFPIRHDPANHRTSDKPLPYDMGRMIHYREWNEGVLPAPWVDNGIEVYGTQFFGAHQFDYAAFAIGGPKGTAGQSDFDYTLSRSGERFYVDNNSQPTVGGRLGLTFRLGDESLISFGSSTMLGRYDPDAELGFAIVGADLVLQVRRLFLRLEYLARWTELDPATAFKYAPTADDFSLRDGFYAELEAPIGRVDLIARWDGLRHFGNVPATSPLRSRSVLLRYTAGAAISLGYGMRAKTSVELYDFSDLGDQLAIHFGVVGSF